MKQFLAVVERAADDTWSAYVPDLPGCTSFGPSREQARQNIRDAIKAHLAELRQAGAVLPEPTSRPELVEVPS